MNMRINGIDTYDYQGKSVLLRLDINSPVDPESKKIIDETRIRASIPSIKYLLEKGARLVIIAHQGDTLDYQNLVSLEEHVAKIAGYLGQRVQFIDDVAGPAARQAIRALSPGEVLLLDNLRYLTEEVSTFEDAVKLQPEEMVHTYLVRNLAPLFDIYVNDAFAAAHRNCPSMVAFQELMPSAGGIQMLKEVTALARVKENPVKPAVFLLGGAKISDAFSMMRQVLEDGAADRVLTSGVTGLVMLHAKGYALGAGTEKYIRDRQLDLYFEPAAELLRRFPEKVIVPLDLACENPAGKRRELKVEELPVTEPLLDVGTETIRFFKAIIKNAGTIFVNGPAGAYEKELFATGTRQLWQAVAASRGFSVIGGGDTVSAAARFTEVDRIDYICTGGGAMVRFLSGIRLPLLEAMAKASKRRN